MSRAKYSVYVDPMFPVQIIPYLEDDEQIYATGMLKDIKQKALEELEEVYKRNREAILSFSEKTKDVF